LYVWAYLEYRTGIDVLTHPVIAKPLDLTLSSASGKEGVKNKNKLHLFPPQAKRGRRAQRGRVSKILLRPFLYENIKQGFATGFFNRIYTISTFALNRGNCFAIY